jgi:DNA-binding MarR family transcriptional regulator
LSSASPDRPSERDPVVDAVLLASRALVAVAARSIAAAGSEVTLPQYRVLVLIAARGPQRPADLAVALNVNPSTASRMCDRLVDRRLVRRSRLSSDRRVVRVTLTPEGRELVDAATRLRRRDLARILGRMTAEQRAAVVSALSAFADAADEVAVPDADQALVDPVLDSTPALRTPNTEPTVS